MMSLTTANDAVNGQMNGADINFEKVVADSRLINGGELFVALKGRNFDGHNFIAQAKQSGAAAAMVSEDGEPVMPVVRVADTTTALGELASYWRSTFEVPVIAITGSNGKTTVKHMVGAILRERGLGVVTDGNFNNHIGLPLTILKARSSDQYFVLEMGMNHFGEIDYLTQIAKPTVAVITNASAAHLQGLGSVERVAAAKMEIFNGLHEQGTAILNADDTYYETWKKQVGSRHCITFGMQHHADVCAEIQAQLNRTIVKLQSPLGECELNLQFAGAHSVMNALAAVAATLPLNVSLDQIKSGLEKVTPMTGRLQVKSGRLGATIIDDTYNANPVSLEKGVQVLALARGERVLVLGDMAELGEASIDLHRSSGEHIRKLGVDRLYALGELSQHTAKAFGDNAKWFADRADLIKCLRDELHSEMTLLIKGSRVMRMETIVNALCDNPANDQLSEISGGVH